MTVRDVITEATAYLSDPNQSYFSDALLFPFVRRAMDELQLELINNGSALLHAAEDRVFEARNTNEEVELEDLIEPIQLYRVEQTSDLYVINRALSVLDYRYSPLDVNQWIWRGGKIILGPHSSQNTVRFLYYKALYDMANFASSTEIAFPNAKVFLSSRVAELAAAAIGMNQALAERFGFEAQYNLQKLISRDVKNQQGALNIRRPYFSLRRRRGYSGFGF